MNKSKLPRIILSIVFLFILMYQFKGTDLITFEMAIGLFVVAPIAIYYFVSKIFNFHF